MEVFYLLFEHFSSSRGSTPEPENQTNMGHRVYLTEVNTQAEAGNEKRIKSRVREGIPSSIDFCPASDVHLKFIV